MCDGWTFLCDPVQRSDSHHHDDRQNRPPQHVQDDAPASRESDVPEQRRQRGDEEDHQGEQRHRAEREDQPAATLLDEAERLCDRIALINDGRLVAEGTTTQLTEMVAKDYGKEPTLESVFMTFTGKSLDDDIDEESSDDDE